MKKNDLEKSINSAFRKTTPDIIGSIISDISDGCEASVTAEPEKRQKPFNIKRFIAAAAVIAVISGIAVAMYRPSRNSSSAISVSLDVNPSVVINADKNEKVTDVIAKNTDGEKVIGSNDYIGNTLDATVDSLVDSMLRYGYISDISNSVLVSVDGYDSKKSDDLKNRLTYGIGEYLAADGLNGAVIGQTLDGSDTENIAKEYGITEGKARLVQRIVDGSRGYYTFGELAGLGITELTIITYSDKTNVEGIEQTGSPSDKAYVGKENAVDAALDHAGIEKSDVDTVIADINLEDGKVVYEIDLNYSGYDYGFLINAVDGSILKFTQEIVYETDAAESTAK